MPDELAPLLITEKAAARLIGLSDTTLIAARFRGAPLLPFVRIGKRSIRYRISDVHAFVNQGVGAGARKGSPTPEQDSKSERERLAANQVVAR